MCAQPVTVKLRFAWKRPLIYPKADGPGLPLLAGSVRLDPHPTAVVCVMPPQLSAGAAPPSRRSDLTLLRDLQDIVDLDAEVPLSFS